ncbi:ABC transporter substrate-binding protein [Natronospirillum operosum]|uniref:ABC transporter substrate-binding protein n=1 Tax=Natronospirillum operosum TaxID=2759953 RepID=A0A4Z0W3P2_9GAMM|nr:ABC transporter substrate-binding protein [Natronospirillum operosum]TGG91342.1 ABC transporter substrate-binding protein [Natronospirillum operosum]
MTFKTMQQIMALAASVVLLGGLVKASTLTIACGAVGTEFEQCQADVQAWAEKTGHSVDILRLPDATNERLDLYQELLNSESPELDIYQLDVVWAGLLAHDLIDLEPYLEPDDPVYFDSLIRNNTVQDRLIALPWFIDTGLLYYRSDLLEAHGRRVPQTRDELTDTAAYIMDREQTGLSGDKLWGFTWQGDSYEGLTCDALEWFHSHTGSSFVETDLSVTINQPGNVDALATAASWIGTISPEETLQHKEEDSRELFQRGDAVFMRNWPYAWNTAQQPDSPVQGRVGIAPLPSGPDGESAATLGGWQLAVSRYSENRELAVELVRFLAGEDTQKTRALESGYNPAIPALYDDPELLAAFPQFEQLVQIFHGGVARPASATGRGYPLVSRIIQRNVHRALSGTVSPEESLQNMHSQLVRQSHWFGHQPIP